MGMPGHASYKEGIHSDGRGRQWQRALELFENLKTSGNPPGHDMWTQIMFLCNTPDTYEVVLELFEDAKQSGIKPDESMYDQAINACEIGVSETKGIAAERFHERADMLRAMRDGRQINVGEGTHRSGAGTTARHGDRGGAKARVKKAPRRIPGQIT